MKNNIAVFVEVFNEEARIENFCKFFDWADELIVIDKSSTDRTVEIAKSFTSNVIVVPYTDTTSHFIDVVNGYKTACEWFLFPTASSAIEPGLVNAITDITIMKSLEYDVISLPLKMYVLGLSGNGSPWSGKYKDICIRKSALKLTSNIHQEISFIGDKIYKGLMGSGYYLYHFTHNNLDIFFERHLRYAKKESTEVSNRHFKNNNNNLCPAFKEILTASYHVLIRRKTYILGWNGVALGLAYISYFIMKFLYTWELSRNQKNTDVYFDEKNRLLQLWNNQ